MLAKTFNVPVSSFFPPGDSDNIAIDLNRPDIDQLRVLKHLSLIPKNEQKVIAKLVEALAQRSEQGREN